MDRNNTQNSGLPPGAIVFTGEQKIDEVLIYQLVYGEKTCNEISIKRAHFQQIQVPTDSNLHWFDIRGVHDTELVAYLGHTFQIHPLILEDITDTSQRPKFEEYENGIFIIVKALKFDATNLEIDTEQIGIYFTNELLISFQEDETDLFEAIRLRIESGKGRIRKKKIDYLAYALIDNIVDQYYAVLDEIEDITETLEDQIIEKKGRSVKEKIHHLKKELYKIRKSIMPLREAIKLFTKSDNAIIDETSSVFVRDLYDHLAQLVDMTDAQRDMLNGLQDLYLSEISMKMNQVMQVLAIVTTIFVPMSFLAGLYGMNFEHMPELKYRYGYYILLAVMLMIFIGALVFFKRKKWL